MKKSFVAMVLILVLCMSQFLIGNAEGKALDITESLQINEGDVNAFKQEDVDGGVKFTATSVKGSYSYVWCAIDQNAKEYTTVRVVVDGKAGTKVLLKLEGGGADVKEQEVTLEGGEQVITWTVEAANLTETSGQKFIMFLNPGKEGVTANDPEWMTVKSVKLCTADYVEPAVPETPETGDSFNMVPAVMMALAAFVFVVAYAKKRAF